MYEKDFEMDKNEEIWRELVKLQTMINRQRSLIDYLCKSTERILTKLSEQDSS